MGEVWAAVHTVTEQRRALKLVDEHDESTRRRMLREARAAAAVRHPNVVAMHDVVESEDGAPVLVMDLLEGETLEAKIEREGRIGVADAVRIAIGVTAGLEAAHALGIVHRDLKPANVFLTPEPKILDFGVAKLTAESGPARATNLLTESGAMVGTPCYMAPEQAFGDGEVDARTDLWALGVLLYECLSGVRPADGATVGQVFKVLATGAIVPLATRAPDVPRVLTVLVDRLLSTSPAGRPASAGAVREELAAIDLSSTVSTSSASFAPDMRSETTDSTAVLNTTARGRRPFSVAIAVAALALATAVAGVWSRRVPAPPSPSATASAIPTPSATPAPTPTPHPPPTAAPDAGPPRASAPTAHPKRSLPAPVASAPASAAAPASKLLTEPPF